MAGINCIRGMNKHILPRVNGGQRVTSEDTLIQIKYKTFVINKGNMGKLRKVKKPIKVNNKMATMAQKTKPKPPDTDIEGVGSISGDTKEDLIYADISNMTKNEDIPDFKQDLSDHSVSIVKTGTDEYFNSNIRYQQILLVTQVKTVKIHA